MSKRYGQWALIAGAAEGIGAGFTEELARLGTNIIMVDHQGPALLAFSKHIEKTYAVSTLTIQQDLGDPNACHTLMNTIASLDCRLMVYVAAYSKVRPFLENTGEDLDRFIDVNNRTMIQLVHSFGLRLKNRGEKGGILLISSLAGLIGPPLVASYAATKGFIILLGETLHHEWKSSGIDITVCCAGVTATPMYLANNPVYGFFKPQIQQPLGVARYALKMLGRKAVCISGLENRLTYFLLLKLLPRKLAGHLVSQNMFKIFSK